MFQEEQTIIKVLQN